MYVLTPDVSAADRGEAAPKPALSRTGSAGAAAALAMLVGLSAQPTPAAAQVPPTDFDGNNVMFFIAPSSTLRYGESLLSKRYMTVGTEGMQVKGRGRCTSSVCPVSFNGIDLFARRWRLRTDAPGTLIGGGLIAKPGTRDYQDGKRCEGITRTLRRGDENNEVRILQEILIKAGFNQVTADGKFGRGTTDAVVQLQRRANMTADGTVGPKTLAILPCSGSSEPIVRPGSTGYEGKRCDGITRTLRRGDENNEVRILQELLIKAGYSQVTADGKYGRKTVDAVIQLQRRANMKADGTVGPATLAILPC